MIVHDLLKQELSNSCIEFSCENIEAPLSKIVEEYLKGKISDRRLEEALLNLLAEIRVK